MPLSFIVSPSIELLADEFVSTLERHPLSVFQPVTIVTQTSGIEQWLKLRMAEKIGIAAHVRCMNPSDLMGNVFRLLGGSYRRQLWSGGTEWLLFHLLDESAFKSRYREVASYYDEPTDDGAMNRLALAGQVADLFDQYQVYRSDMIREWNSKPIDANKDADWQLFLWQRLKDVSAEAVPDKTEMADFILRQLDEPDSVGVKRLKHHLPMVHLFGLSVLTEYHIRLLQKIANHVQVVVYFKVPLLDVLQNVGLKNETAPSIKNELLKSWGHLIVESTEVAFNVKMSPDINRLTLADQSPVSLLEKLQFDIRNNLSVPTAISENDLHDGSLTVNACYTAVREVESLYNYLVKMIDGSEKPVSPRDIVVLMGDVDAYAPYVKAVFDHAPYSIPYSIEGEGVESSEGVITALRAVLMVTEEAFTSEAVVRLLDSGQIRERFGISDVNLIRQIVDKANIRLGIDGNREDDSYLVSWMYGLKRIVFGMCMSGGGVYDDPDGAFYPIDDLEGKSSFELMSFVHFVQVLVDTIRQRDQPRPLTEWTAYVEMVLHNLIYESGDEPNEEYSMISNQLLRINGIGDMVPEAVSYDLFMSHFECSLSGQTTFNHHRGGVVFSSMIPMRGLPFKVVALLGLNFDKFPRREQHLSYDLIAQYPQPGDRNVKDNDKHLFLETLMSAKERLYLSYVGRNAGNNSVLPPSSIIDELIDYIESASDCAKQVRDKLIAVQPLHSFSNKYGKAPYYSYLKQGSTPVSVKRLMPSVELPDLSVVELHKLLSFFRNPIKAYYNQALGIDYSEYGEEQLAESELFELDHLQEWIVKNDLLKMDDAQIDSYVRQKVMTGSLPLKNEAIVCVDSIREGIVDLKDEFLRLSLGLEESVIDIDCVVGTSNLTGQISNIFGNRMVFFCFSSNHKKYLLDAFIRYLVVRSQGLDVGLQFITFTKGVSVVTDATLISVTEANEMLVELMGYYRQGREAFWFFYPNFNFNWAGIEQLNNEELQVEVDKQFVRYPFPESEPHVVHAYSNGLLTSDEGLEALKRNTATIFNLITRVFPQFNF